jgi:hypothetical protein
MEQTLKRIEERLRKSGLDEDEIKRTLTILRYGKSNQKNFFLKRIPHVAVYWVSILVAILANAILSVLLVPFIVVLDKAYFFIFVLVFALGLGIIINIILRDIELKGHHHFFSGLVIPLIALINIQLIVKLTNPLLDLSGQARYDPLVVSLMYVIAFMVPYLIMNFPDAVSLVFRKTYKT